MTNFSQIKKNNNKNCRMSEDTFLDGKLLKKTDQYYLDAIPHLASFIKQ